MICRGCGTDFPDERWAFSGLVAFACHLLTPAADMTRRTIKWHVHLEALPHLCGVCAGITFQPAWLPQDRPEDRLAVMAGRRRVRRLYVRPRRPVGTPK